VKVLKLVAEVGMGHAGLVIGLEVSRLARNDPAHFNDRLLLGLKRLDA
jgi:hypothetical protein